MSIDLPPYDLHTHTIHCGHARPNATVANMVAAARQSGLQTLGFAEHVIFPEDSERIARIREELAGVDMTGLRVLVGVEIDPDPLHPDGRWVVDPGSVDFAILSPHRVPRLGVGHWAFAALCTSSAERQRLGEEWLDWYAACVEQPGVTILGHPLREPINLGLLSLRDDRTLARAVAIVQRAAQRGIAFELNNGWCIGVRLAGYEAYVALVREARRSGMRFSRGSDAHAPAEVGDCGDTARLAADAGLQPEDWLDPSTLGG